ncbi:MAG: branched-chain amino acid ABC transporter permease [Oscillospiraceae bacterium]|nr:branched-chain amino acid ABC transporter permease [Oscillospiraceae bacterium]
MGFLDFVIQLMTFGLSLGMLYFLLASGFALIFGLMGVFNYAHGSLFMVGGYLCFVVTQQTGNFWLGLAAAGIGVGVLGLLLEKTLIKKLKGNIMNQIILTFGLIYVIDEIVKALFGNRAYIQQAPEILRGGVEILTQFVPRYRLFMIVAGFVILIALVLLFNKTRLGLVIRAGIEHPEMVRSIGVNIQTVFTITFALGCLLAGLGGGIALPFMGVYPNLGPEQIFNAIAVIIIGGFGNILWSFYAATILGLMQYTVSYFVPVLAMPATLLLMFLILMIRPYGLFAGGKSNE